MTNHQPLRNFKIIPNAQHDTSQTKRLKTLRIDLKDFLRIVCERFKKEKQHKEGWIVDLGQEIFLQRVFLSEKISSSGQFGFVSQDRAFLTLDMSDGYENWCQPVEWYAMTSIIVIFNTSEAIFLTPGTTGCRLHADLQLQGSVLRWSVARRSIAINTRRPCEPRIDVCGSFLRRYPYQPTGTYFERHQQPIIDHTAKRLFFLCDTYLRVCCGAESFISSFFLAHTFRAASVSFSIVSFSFRLKFVEIGLPSESPCENPLFGSLVVWFTEIPPKHPLESESEASAIPSEVCNR